MFLAAFLNGDFGAFLGVWIGVQKLHYLTKIIGFKNEFPRKMFIFCRELRLRLRKIEK